jgi:hypothetical protein
MFLLILENGEQTIDKLIITLSFFTVRSIVKLFYFVEFYDNYKWYL